MTAPKPESVEPYREMWERLKKYSETTLAHWYALLRQYEERKQVQHALVATYEIEHYKTMLGTMQCLEAESGGKE